MTFIPRNTPRLPVLGFLEKANPTVNQTVRNDEVENITFVDNSNSTESNNLNLNNKDALVFAQFSREDELDSSTVSILVGDSNSETRIARVSGNSTNNSTDIQYRYQSSSIAIDMISAANGLNIRKHYTNSNSSTVDYGDGTCIFFIRSIE